MRWQRKPIEDIADFTLGKMLDQKKNKGELLPYLANVNVRWGSFQLDDLREMRFEPHEADRFGLKYGDIVMCEGGEPGRCAIWMDHRPKMMIQKALHRIRSHDGVDNRFLFYSFLHIGKTGGFAPLFTGSTIKHLPREKLAKVEVDIPPIQTQQKIASILSTYDDLIENNRRRMALMEDAARQVYQEWFVRLRFPGCEHSRIVDGVPEGWQRKTLGDSITLNYGKALKADIRVDGPFAVYGSSGIVGSIFWSSKNFYPIDTVYFISTESSNLYLYHSLKCMHFINTDVAVPGLNRNLAYSRQLLLPTNTIMRAFLEVVTPMQEQLEKLEEMNQKLCTARDLLLPKLMSGKITV